MTVTFLLASGMPAGKQENPMELNLHPIATKCFSSRRDFQEGDRVVCYLVREENGQAGRRDLLESEDGNVTLPLEIYCRWVVNYRPLPVGEDSDRQLKLTAENLFLTLADAANPPSDSNTPLLQFLALMLERKRLLKLRGMSADGQRQLFEHMPSHQMYEVPAGTLDEAFFVRIQEQPKAKVEPAAVAPAG
jgi:hypothetical protein